MPANIPVNRRDLSPIAVMERHVLTLFRVNPAGRLTGINEPGNPVAPRVFLGRTRQGHVWRFRQDLPETLVQDLERILAHEPLPGDLREPPITAQALSVALAAHAPIEQRWHGPAWWFPEGALAGTGDGVVAVHDSRVLQAYFPSLAATLSGHQPCLAILHEADAVTVCFSARTSTVAAEAGVETAEPFRGRGYASAVVAAWARAVTDQGRLPLYSTSWENRASQAVARRLGLMLYGDDFHIT